MCVGGFQGSLALFLRALLNPEYSQHKQWLTQKQPELIEHLSWKCNRIRQPSLCSLFLEEICKTWTFKTTLDTVCRWFKRLVHKSNLLNSRQWPHFTGSDSIITSYRWTRWLMEFGCDQQLSSRVTYGCHWLVDPWAQSWKGTYQ